MDLEKKFSTLPESLEHGSPVRSLELVANRRIGAEAVRELCGGISDMTLWRWLADDALSFPQPARIGRRRYWREQDIIVWLDEQADSK